MLKSFVHSYSMLEIGGTFDELHKELRTGAAILAGVALALGYILVSPLLAALGVVSPVHFFRVLQWLKH